MRTPWIALLVTALGIGVLVLWLATQPELSDSSRGEADPAPTERSASSPAVVESAARQRVEGSVQKAVADAPEQDADQPVDPTATALRFEELPRMTLEFVIRAREQWVADGRPGAYPDLKRCVFSSLAVQEFEKVVERFHRDIEPAIHQLKDTASGIGEDLAIRANGKDNEVVRFWSDEKTFLRESPPLQRRQPGGRYGVTVYGVLEAMPEKWLNAIVTVDLDDYPHLKSSLEFFEDYEVYREQLMQRVWGLVLRSK